MAVNIYDSFLTEELWNEVWEEIDWATQNYVWNINNFKWAEHLVCGSPPVLLHSLSNANNKELFQKLCDWDVAKLPHTKELYENPNLNISKIIYLWTNGSYITWHGDEKYLWASSLYLNKEWHPNWGGYFMHEENERTIGIPPVPNRCVEQTEQVQHTVNEIRLGDTIPFRVSLQTFLMESEEE